MTIPEGILEQYISFFRGRSDCYGGWDGFQKKEPLTEAVFAKHLTNGPYIGVYPSITDLCSWGCIDIDGKDFPMWEAGDDYPKVEGHDWDAMFVLARNLQAVLAAGSVSAHIERTRNGFHIWVFPQEPLIRAATMRRALMAVCTALDYDPKEVNPKQEVVGSGERVKYGNYVRLPYYGWFSRPHDPQPDRYMVDANCVCIDLGVWLADAKRAHTYALESLAELWTPPVKSFELDDTAGMEAENVVQLLDGIAFTIWKDGPLEGSDRSQTLAKLAHKVRDSGLGPEGALVVLRSANARWGKWHDDPDHAEQQLRRLVENAY